ncbi:hypothetical protein ES702_01545 [subsurface metagenome]
MTAGQITSLKKELKNWQKIYESKKNVVTVLVGMALKKEVTHKIKNVIVDNLLIERDAEHRIKIIKVRLGIR